MGPPSPHASPRGAMSKPRGSGGGTPNKLAAKRKHEEENDDELERTLKREEDARKRKEMYAGRTSVGGSPRKTPAPPAAGVTPAGVTPAPRSAGGGRATPAVTPGITGFDYKTAVAMWEENIERTTQNKINVKNVWQVGGMEKLTILAKKWGRDGNFHTSSVALESAAKIFAYRVDALGLQSQQVQSALRRGDTAPEEDAVDEEGRPRARRRRVQTNTLAANAEELDLKEHERAFEIDPLFALTSQSFDQGGPKGMLLNNCPIGQFLNIQLDSSTASSIFHTIQAPKVEEEENYDATGALQQIQDQDAGLVTAREAADAAGAEKDGIEAAVLQELKALGGGVPGAKGWAAPPAGAPAPGVRASGGDSDDGGGDDGGFDMGGDDIDAADMVDASMFHDGADDDGRGLADHDDEAALQGRLGAIDQLKLGDGLRQRGGDGAADDGGSDDGSDHTDISVASRLGFDDDDKEALLFMHGGSSASQNPSGRSSAWQGPFDTLRWKILRQSQAAGVASAAFGPADAKAAEQRAMEKKRERAQGIDFGIDWDSSENKEKEDELNKALKLAPKAEMLMLQRGRDRHQWERVHGGKHGPLQNDYLNPSIMERHRRQNRIVLPDDHRVTTDYFFQLHCLPNLPQWNLINKWKPESKRRKTFGGVQPEEDRELFDDAGGGAGEGDDEAMPVDIDLDAADDGGGGGGWDANDYGGGGDDDDDAPPGRDTVGQREALLAEAGIDMIDRPDEINRQQVAYARSAKVVDIKMLKDTMWHSLRRPQTPEDGPELKRRRGPDGKQYVVEPILFSELVMKMQPMVRARNIAANASDISISFYYICLLHLCNDHNMRIEQNEEMSDCKLTPN